MTMTFTPSGSPEFHDAVTNTVTSVIRSDADHDEMMRYIAELNKLRDDYKKLSEQKVEFEAAYNEQVAIIKEHSHEMSISKDQINERVDKAVDIALGKLKR
jgi:hypothetical protein